MKTGGRGGTIKAYAGRFRSNSRPSGFAPRSCSALPSCWRSRPPAWASPISALSAFPPASMSYRRSVPEADLARNIDRELISYRSLARYFVATGKEEDGKAALAAEASLKEAIIASMKGTTNPARLDQVTKLAREFRAFTKIFADILKVKDESARIAQNQLTRGGTTLRYKLDDLASNADEAELPAVSSAPSRSPSNFRPRRRSPTPSSSIPTRRSRPARWRV